MKMELILRARTRENVSKYVITDKQAEILQGADDVEAADMFRDITGMDVNFFACVDHGTWFVARGEIVGQKRGNP